MEDVVGIIAHDEEHGPMAFLTWGGIFESPEALLDAVRAAMGRFGLPANVRLTVARTLQDVAKYPYFYEGLLHFGRLPAPTPATREAAQADLREGRTLYGLGRVIGAV
ncbi:MAG TPA: hypothetical protein VMD91_01145 [Candidatus Sulfotelmatobacter sp.]|nr:hypothetical protein [Candidatus Sulfotelmatobacter sp.]